VQSNVYLFGGVFYDWEKNELVLVENCIWKLDLNDLRWQKLDIKMPLLTYFHAAAITQVTILKLSFENEIKI
jgi:N-acetylneuraminic acid mutarotase